MERVDKLISSFIKRRFGLSLGQVYSRLRSGLLQDVEVVRCNLCEGHDTVTVAQRDKYDLPLTSVMCRNCGLMYLNPRPTAQSYDRFYNEGSSEEGVYHVPLSLDNVDGFLQRYFGSDFRLTDEDRCDLHAFIRAKYREHVGGDEKDMTEPDMLRALEVKAREFEDWRYDTYAEDIYRYFRDFVPRGGAVFEVGAAWGKLLIPWREQHDCAITGLEPRKATVQAAKEQFGIELFHGFPATADIPEAAYDVVFNIRTINHMLDPVGDLRHGWRWLKPGGVMIVDISDAVREARYEGFENNVVEIDHTYMFTAKTLSAMMQKAGFEILRCDTIDTRQVFDREREPEYKQIRIVGRKLLDPVPVAWPDAMQELADLLRAQLDREMRLLSLQAQKGEARREARRERDARSRARLKAKREGKEKKRADKDRARKEQKEKGSKAAAE